MTGWRYWGRIALCVVILILTLYVAAKAQNNNTERIQLHVFKQLEINGGYYYGTLQVYCDTGNGVMIYLTAWGSNRAIAAVPNACGKQ